MENVKDINNKIKNNSIKTHQIMETNYSVRKYPFYDNFRMNDEEELNKKLLYEIMRLDG